MGIVRDRTNPRKESSVFRKWNLESTLGNQRSSLPGVQKAGTGGKKRSPLNLDKEFRLTNIKHLGLFKEKSL